MPLKYVVGKRTIKRAMEAYFGDNDISWGMEFLQARIDSDEVMHFGNVDEEGYKGANMAARDALIKFACGKYGPSNVNIDLPFDTELEHVAGIEGKAGVYVKTEAFERAHRPETA